MGYDQEPVAAATTEPNGTAADQDEVEYAPHEVYGEYVREGVTQAPLIEGRRMRCPRCERLHDILAYVPMQIVEKYAANTNPIYKCPNCRWIFSPGATALTDMADEDVLARAKQIVAAQEVKPR